MSLDNKADYDVFQFTYSLPQSKGNVSKELSLQQIRQMHAWTYSQRVQPEENQEEEEAVFPQLEKYEVQLEEDSKDAPRAHVTD